MAHQAVFPITTMARVLGVSKAGYYAWIKRRSSARAEADGLLLKRIRTIHVTSHATYGVPRVHAELLAGGEKHGRKRIARPAASRRFRHMRRTAIALGILEAA